MKLKTFAQVSILVLQAFTSVTFARSVSVADPKQQLGLTEGNYRVVSTASSDEDSFCSLKSEYTVSWFESKHGLALSIGDGILNFNRLNAGPTDFVDSEAGESCKTQVDTQTETGRLTSNVFTKCAKSTTTELTVLKITPGVIEYKKEIKVPRKGGKTVVVTSACTLKKI